MERLLREQMTIQAMIHLYCRFRHAQTGTLCGSCADLAQYATLRVESCPFGAQKPTCRDCSIHCYRPDMRHRVREVMRFAGPRMLFFHPVLALRHLCDQFSRKT